MIALLKRLKTEYAIPVSELIADTGFSRSTYLRWKRRIERGETAVKKPGPKRIAPLSLSELKEEIENLSHGKKRSKDTRRLYEKYRPGISRREFDEMVKEARDSHNRWSRASLCRLEWHRPNLAWSLDGAEVHQRKGKVHIQNVQDLCSRYKFTPLTTDYMPCGEEVAGHLSHQFGKFDPPLFIKRDNGGNLNHPSVNEVLEEAMVIPINSPVRNAPYNGAIEHSQGEFKSYLRLWEDKARSREELDLLIETAAHDLNHQQRRSLEGKNACQTYFGQSRDRYPKRKRKEVYEWIRDLAIEISEKSGKKVIAPCAIRIAARTWLEKMKLITIHRPGRVSPGFT